MTDKSRAPAPRGRSGASLAPPATMPGRLSAAGSIETSTQSVRERSHWNSPNIRPRDPVLLGLCSQSELNQAVAKAREEAARTGRVLPEPAEVEEVEVTAGDSGNRPDLSIFKLPD
jgi:uncharacterized protein